MLSIKNLFLKYTKEYFALYDINLDVKKGEKVAFLGEPDSGKTSLLRIITKLNKPTSGEVILKGKPLKKINFKTDIEMGYISACPVFYENKTVYDNLKYILKLRKFEKSSIDLKIENTLKEFEFINFKDIKVKDLNLKDKYILSIIRLSLRKLEFLVVDNIFDNLIKQEQNDILDLIKKLFFKDDLTIILATTKTEIAKNMDRTVEFVSGSIKLGGENA